MPSRRRAPTRAARRSDPRTADFARSKRAAAPRAIGKREWLILAAILAVAALLRIAHLAEATNKPDFRTPILDAEYNDYWARALATGDWTPPEPHPDPNIPDQPYFRPPGYPYFLAAIYKLSDGSYLAPRIAQSLLGLGACLLLFLIARQLFGQPAACIAAGLGAVYWGFIFFESELHEPALLVFLILLFTYALTNWARHPSWPRLAAVGLLLGFYAIVRPNILIVAPLLLIWCIWILKHYNRPLSGISRHAVILTAAALIPVLPVTIRNYVKGGEFVLISNNAGINLYIGNNPHASLVTPRIPEIQQIAARSSWNLFAWKDVVEGVGRIQQRPMSTSDVAAHFRDKAWTFIRENPGQALHNTWQRLLLILGPTEVSNSKVLHYEKRMSPILRWLPGFPLALSGFVLGSLLWLYDRRQRRPAGDTPHDTEPPPEQWRGPVLLAIVGLVFIYLLSFTPFLVAGRFRIPMVPLMLLPTAYTLAWIAERLRAADWRPATGGLATAVALFLLANVSYAEYEPDLGSWHLDRANAYHLAGRLDDAVSEYRLAADVNQNFPDTYAGLAAALAEQGRTDEAIQTYRRAIEIAPRAADLRRKFGLFLFQQSRYAEAADQYRTALDIAPTHAVTSYLLGLAESNAGRPSSAIEAYRRALQLDPALAQARVNLASLLTQAGRLDQAQRQLERALQSQPDLFEAHYNLASVRHKRGDLGGAVASLRRALEIDPGNQAALAALRTLQQNR